MSEKEEKIASWLTEIFRDHNFDTCSFKFPNYDKSGGYAGEMNFADVVAEKNGEQKIIEVIIKKNKDSKVIMDTMSMRVVYANEVKLYSKVLTTFKKFAEKKNTAPFENIPYCYGTIERNDQYVIILENLKPKGFRLHQLQEHMDLDHVKLVLEAYGNWHAFNLAFRDQNREIFDNMGKIMEQTKMVELYKNTIKYEIDETIKLFQNKNKVDIVEKLEKLRARYDKIMDDSISNENEDFIVIKHGDSWNNNFLFHYNDSQSKPNKAIIVDWQLSFFGSPLIDVANFIFACCSTKELEHIEELLMLYYTTLSKKMEELGSDPVKVFPLEACLKSFAKMNELERLMDLEQAKLVIRAYANWHAINLACRDQEPDKFAFFEELMSPHKAGSICELFVGSMMEEIEAAIELFRKENCWEIMKKLTILKEKYAEMFRDCFYNKDESILVVRHADCWNNNLLFHYVDGQTSPDKAVIIDWQLSFVGSPLADVTQFLFYSCDKDTLLQTDHLLEYYYNSLSEKLEELGCTPDKCFPWKICQKTFEKYVAIAVGGVPLNIRFRHKTDMGEQIELQKQSDSSRTFNVFSGKQIRDPKQYFETMKEILEICIERKYI